MMLILAKLPAFLIDSIFRDQFFQWRGFVLIKKLRQ